MWLEVIDNTAASDYLRTVIDKEKNINILYENRDTTNNEWTIIVYSINNAEDPADLKQIGIALLRKTLFKIQCYLSGYFPWDSDDNWSGMWHSFSLETKTVSDREDDIESINKAKTRLYIYWGIARDNKIKNVYLGGVEATMINIPSINARIGYVLGNYDVTSHNSDKTFLWEKNEIVY